MITMEELQNRLSDMMAYAARQGADEADGIALVQDSCTLKVRLGALDHLDWSQGLRLGLRVIVGRRQACVTTNNPDPETLTALVDRALLMARVVPQDPYCGLASSGQLVRDFQIPPSDPRTLTIEEMTLRAQEAENAALEVSGVTSSEGATISWAQNDFVLAVSNGFVGGYRSSLFDLGVAVLAGEGDQKQIDGYYSQARFLKDLGAPAFVGQHAGNRAVRRLHPRKALTGSFPVVYENLISPSLLGHLASGITGSAIAEKTSFLSGALEQPIFPETITVMDDPFLPQGMGSYPFDGEGIAAKTRMIVDRGVLKTWLLNLRAGRQLGLPSTGHGTAALGGAPGISCSNFYMKPGSETLKDLLRPISSGYFVTDLLGHSVNNLTGDYSLGSCGFWIEKGEILYPVQGVTLAGNLKDMFQGCTPANDLMFRGSISAPTLRISAMTVAGQ